MTEQIKQVFEEHLRTIERTANTLTGPIEAAAALLTGALEAGNKILVMGNGGSAADAQHFAAEMVGRFLMERKALPALALTTDSSILTALGNDYGFERVFSRQVEALAAPGDVVIGISTSGNSENVLAAMKAAREIGCRTVGLLGGEGGGMTGLVDVALTVPSDRTPRIQEAHQTVIHILCDLVETRLFSEGTP
ncbi:MAG: phosphoheptose isomerase [Desulfuromonas sp.]|uniref:D-sedoheptulose 7-phosphate isomerase n=1 Tax=Desulfuromonas sp. TaxID=892 RepID=UPI000CBFC0A8|nr:D-sedoheptulose 7-phosphate isomerase [Desulfuromonas sp.]PLX84772.1 MAG: phosphoheptose isomerase [Desulfuromonas sp.]